MLSKRILTALPLALLVLWVILFQSSQVFAWLLYAVAGIAAWEWALLSGLRPPALRMLYALAVLMIAVVLVETSGFDHRPFMWLVVIWWSYISLRLFSYVPATMRGPSWSKMLLGVLLMPMAVVAMYEIHAQHSAHWLLYGLMLVWVADIGAYFAGRRFGRNKLAPAISPGKTREGLYGALVATTLYTLVAAGYFGLDAGRLLLLVLLSLALTLVSVAGDLYESVLKREFGVKDSGHILPGHGGMLDRIDSVLAAMPVFAVGIGLVLSDGAASS